MPRYKLTIEYDGTPFVGWQRQANGLSVQQAIEEAFLAFSGEAVSVSGAGRTDAGVHALGQVAHAELQRDLPAATVARALNALLRPHPIAVIWAETVGEDFDARFSATARHYRYRILNRAAPPALDANRVWPVRHAIDIEAMRAGAQHLIGRHDFTTFRAAECQAKSPLRTLDRLDIERSGDLVTVEASARSFLHSQVRSMVGSLVKVGTGKWPASRIAEALAAKDRAACGPLAPPAGLYLLRVDY
ncbi:MAG: tRNA pseudouridine(38-40) synthase TruA [Bauldia sp.]